MCAMKTEKSMNYSKQVGRKAKSDPAVHRYGIKLNSIENAKFMAQYNASGLTEKSKFIKAVLFSRQIKVVKIDKATCDYYMRLTNFYHQFQAIGNNYNQTVTAIKANFGEKRAVVLLYKLFKMTTELASLNKQIIELTREFEYKFLGK